MNSMTAAAGKGFDGAINFLVVVGWPTTLCVEIGFYVDISQESRCHSEIKI